ncbi:Hansenula MRAKII killer toxin-resistant protein 1 [Actinoplanes sp. NPDC051859]|uniref:Hansenula MRAKII killer toxin-resistant protein 1 n=1 Tax=Actinoplanes sp. NPDC051859 TaxID=3363909 RepID=UPI00379C51B6
MAARGWTAQVGAAAGVAAGTGAAQLGLGYGLGVVVWPAGVTAGDTEWVSSLGWATWTAASATVFGAVIASRLGRTAGGLWRFALAASAAVGALLTVALIALPARASVREDTFSPETLAGGYAVIGVLVGLVLAFWATGSRPVAANLIATACWLWSLAVAAVVTDVVRGMPTAAYLSSWQFLGWQHSGTIHWRDAGLTLLATFLLGIIGAWAAARRGDLGIGTSTSGAVGPLLVAVAFLALAPQLTTGLGPLGSAFLTAPYAVLAGLAGSAVTVAIGQRWATRRATKSGALSIPAQRPTHRPALPAASAPVRSTAGETGRAAAGAGRGAMAEAERASAAGSGRTSPAEAGRVAGTGSEGASVVEAGKAAKAKAGRTGWFGRTARSGGKDDPRGTDKSDKSVDERVSRGPQQSEPDRVDAPRAQGKGAEAIADSTPKRSSLLGRLRRSQNAAETSASSEAGSGSTAIESRSGENSGTPAIVTGRAQAPASARSSPQGMPETKRETVARPPNTPAVAKINPPVAGGAPPAPGPRAGSHPGPRAGSGATESEPLIRATPEMGDPGGAQPATPPRKAATPRKAPAKKAAGTRGTARSKPPIPGANDQESSTDQPTPEDPTS